MLVHTSFQPLIYSSSVKAHPLEISCHLDLSLWRAVGCVAYPPYRPAVFASDSFPGLRSYSV
jgi:hypothetical protein